jgi:hypothetical protein
MANPHDETSLTKLIKEVKGFNTAKFLYPDAVMDPILTEMMNGDHKGRVRPPKLIFMPSVRFIREVVKIILKYGQTDTTE